jgi:glycerophosphoryl diester phosphodiesterase
MTEIFAHRGSCHRARENTIAAFLAARGLGADGIELDVHLTADGNVVVHHDFEVPGLGPISKRLSSELPSWLPSLVDALDACRPLLVNVEIKHEESEPFHTLAFEVAAILAARSEAKQIVVSSFSLSAIDAVRAFEPDLATALLVEPDQNPMNALEIVRQRGHRGLHPFFFSVDATLMTAAKAFGIAVRAWTADDPVRIAALADLGVDAVVTNDVPAALRALGRSAKPTASEPDGT